MYRTFTRNWYVWGRTPQGKRYAVPPKKMPRRNFTGQIFSTETEARAACAEYNAAHDPGPLSHKMEYERF